MRRKDREITDLSDKIKIIAKCKTCRLGLVENNRPYIVPLNYGFSYENQKLTLYFHSTKDGKKMNIIQNNNNACFEIDCDTRLIEGEKACNYSCEFKSIIGFGKIAFLETPLEKITGLNYLMKHQTGKEIEYGFTKDELKDIVVYKIETEEFTGKQRI